MSVTPLRLVFNPQGALRAAAEDCEAEVFLTWFGNTSAQLQEEYGPYDHHSVFLAVVDRHDVALGSIRMITGATGRLKTLDDIERDPWNVDRHRAADAADIDPFDTWDYTTLAVRHGRPGSQLMVAAALYHGVVMTYRANGFKTIVGIVDEKVRSLGEAVGLRFHNIPGTSPKSYLGSPASVPVYGHCAAVVDTQRRYSPDGYRLVSQGIGLDGIHIPPVEAFRLPDAVRPVVDLDATEFAESNSFE